MHDADVAHRSGHLEFDAERGVDHSAVHRTGDPATAHDDRPRRDVTHRPRDADHLVDAALQVAHRTLVLEISGTVAELLEERAVVGLLGLRRGCDRCVDAASGANRRDGRHERSRLGGVVPGCDDVRLVRGARRLVVLEDPLPASRQGVGEDLRAVLEGVDRGRPRCVARDVCPEQRLVELVGQRPPVEPVLIRALNGLEGERVDQGAHFQTEQLLDRCGTLVPHHALCLGERPGQRHDVGGRPRRVELVAVGRDAEVHRLLECGRELRLTLEEGVDLGVAGRVGGECRQELAQVVLCEGLLLTDFHLDRSSGVRGVLVGTVERLGDDLPQSVGDGERLLDRTLGSGADLPGELETRHGGQRRKLTVRHRPQMLDDGGCERLIGTDQVEQVAERTFDVHVELRPLWPLTT